MSASPSVDTVPPRIDWAFLATLGVALAAAVAMLTGFTVADTWSTEDRAVLASMSLDRLPPAPHDPSNAVDSVPAAAALGQRLFAEVRLSRNQAVSCASCHVPDRQFQDGLAVGRGVGTGSRRTMPITGTAHSPWLFWDGRKDSLWSQALGPLEDGVEHGSNRTRIAQVLGNDYRAEYEALFGPMPDLTGLPQDAGPQGTAAERAAWEGMASPRRDDVNRVFANLGKAIAAYERTLTPGESRFDRYVRATLARDPEAQRVLSPQEVNGLRLFIGKGQCATCHNGPLLTDQQFHNTGVPARDPLRPDRGRAVVTAKAKQDEFNCLGKYSDAAPEACQELRFMVADDPALEGAFKTPGLRDVALRPPYMHAGQIATLEEVVAHYAASPRAAVGRSELAHDGPGRAERQPIRLSASEVTDVAAFLRTLSGAVTPNARAESSTPAAPPPPARSGR